MNKKPTFEFIFKEKAAVAISGSVRGVLGVLMFDTTGEFKTKEYYNSAEVRAEDWSPENLKILKALAFRGNPFKVKVYKATLETLTTVLKEVEMDEPNYFCCPLIPTDPARSSKSARTYATLKDDLISWINGIRNNETIKLGNDTSTIKLVISANSGPDKPWILDYDMRQTTHGIAGLDDVYYDAQAYTLCVASMAAGCALNSSLTSMAQPWLKTFVTTITNENEAIAAGKLITGYDGEKYIILRGVTSFVTPTDDMNRSFSKIRKMEIMDLHQKDIRNTFKYYYRGKYQNFYPNKLLFLGAVNSYLDTFVKNGQLDPANENRMKIDLQAHRNFLLGKGVYQGKPITEEEIKKLSDYELLRINTDDIVFAYVPDYKPTDVMEDFKGEAYL